MRIAKLIILFILTVALLLMCVTIVPSSASADWSPYSTLSAYPQEMFPGESLTASYNLHIGEIPGSFAVLITSVTTKYPWDSAAVELLSSQINATSLPFDVTLTRDLSVPEDLALGAHYGSIVVVGKALTGDVFSSSYTWRHYFNATAPLQLSIAASTSAGQAPLLVDFISLAQGGSTPYSYSWNFGDGQSSTANSPSHTYSTAGTYTAELEITDVATRRISNTTQITVTAPPPALTASIFATATSGPPPLAVSFTSNVQGGTPGYTYSWTFSDGGTSNSANPSHTFNDVGTYTAHLTVTDSVSVAAQSNDLTINVTNPPPALTASISTTTTSVISPFTVSFSSNVHGGTSPYSYSWTFGDGGSSTLPNPTHTYTGAGTRSVQLTLTDSSSSVVSSNTLSIIVTTPTPAPTDWLPWIIGGAVVIAIAASIIYIAFRARKK